MTTIETIFFIFGLLSFSGLLVLGMLCAFGGHRTGCRCPECGSRLTYSMRTPAEVYGSAGKKPMLANQISCLKCRLKKKSRN